VEKVAQDSILAANNVAQNSILADANNVAQNSILAFCLPVFASFSSLLRKLPNGRQANLESWATKNMEVKKWTSQKSSLTNA